MNRAAAMIAVAASGCCGDRVGAVLAVGHLSPADCRDALLEGPPPSAISCPGTEVTLCWTASKSVTIDATDDALGIDGPESQLGIKYFTPTKDTEVEVRASDCAKIRRKVVVADQPVGLIEDAGWKNGCQYLEFKLNPHFFDTRLHANWIEADFLPHVFLKGDPANDPPIPDQDVACSFPPFLDGNKLMPPHAFTLDKPFDQHQFSSQPPAVDTWQFWPLFTCPAPMQCNPGVTEPFRLQLTCTPSHPD